MLSTLLLFACESVRFDPIADPMPPAPHPPMGWNSWYAFGENISDSLIREQADAMLANGMHQVGYEYVNLDDGWEGERDSAGILHPNANFPDMKALGEYLHSRGLKFGIYTSMGPLTCTGHIGSQKHEEQDIQVFLAWGIDFVKYDLCHFYPPDVVVEEILIHKFAMALRAQETRPVVLSIVMMKSPWTWAPSLAVNMWRIQPDAQNNYTNMMQIADFDAGLSDYASETAWNDPDMLQVGRAGMTANEYRIHMTLWSMLAAPLLASTDLRSISPSDLGILTNTEVIKINQDSAAHQSRRIVHSPSLDIWVKKLSTGNAIAIINRGDHATTYKFDSRDLGITASQAYEIWSRQTVSLPFAFSLLPHSCALLRTL